jgi:hypothetical protein
MPRSWPASKKQEQIVPTVAGKIYNHSKRMKEKRAVLEGLQRSFGGSLESPPARQAETKLSLAA